MKASHQAMAFPVGSSDLQTRQIGQSSLPTTCCLYAPSGCGLTFLSPVRLQVVLMRDRLHAVF